MTTILLVWYACALANFGVMTKYSSSITLSDFIKVIIQGPAFTLAAAVAIFSLWLEDRQTIII